MPNNDNYEYMRFLDLTGVQQIWDTAKQTFVQTVNGQGIDANGNVNVNSGLTEEQKDFIINEYNKSLNLFNKEAIETGAIKSTDGTATTDATASHTDYIEIEPNTAYSNNMVMNWSGAYGIAFYNSNKAFISGIASNNSNYNHFTTPSTAKYIRISWYNVSSDLTFYTDVDTLMLNKGSTLLTYQSYNGEIIHKKDLSDTLTDTLESFNGKLSLKQVWSGNNVEVQLSSLSESVNNSWILVSIQKNITEFGNYNFKGKLCLYVENGTTYTTSSGLFLFSTGSNKYSLFSVNINPDVNEQTILGRIVTNNGGTWSNIAQVNITKVEKIEIKW